MSVSSPADLAQRYGTDRRRRPWLLLGVALLTLAALAWLVWAMLFHTRPVVTSDLVGFGTPSEHFVEAQVRVVRRDADVTATCLLQAQSADHAIVGELLFTVDGSPATSTTTQTIRTERRATAVSLLGCSSPPEQPQRR